MFGSNRIFLKKIDELEERSVELARQVKELSDENKELKDLRIILTHNNTKLINKNRELNVVIENISKLSEINTYGNEKVILSKIKELVRDYQSKN